MSERMSDERLAELHVDAIGGHNMKSVDVLVNELRGARQRVNELEAERDKWMIAAEKERNLRESCALDAIKEFQRLGVENAALKEAVEQAKQDALPYGRCCDNGNFGEEHDCQKLDCRRAETPTAPKRRWHVHSDACVFDPDMTLRDCFYETERRKGEQRQGAESLWRWGDSPRFKHKAFYRDQDCRRKADRRRAEGGA